MECLSQCVKKTEIWREERNGVGISSLFVLTIILMPVFIKNFFANMLLLIYRKEQLKLQYLCKTTYLATKLKHKFSWRERNSYEVATTKHRYGPYRERMENHRKFRTEILKILIYMVFWKNGNVSLPLSCKLIGSRGWRCNEVIQCKGKFTKYWIFL